MADSDNKPIDPTNWCDTHRVFNPKRRKSEHELSAIAKTRMKAREIKKRNDKTRRD